MGILPHWVCQINTKPIFQVVQHSSNLRQYIANTMSMDIVLPGQPIPLPARGPAPQLGTGVYERDGQIRASLLGAPCFDGSVRRLLRHP